MKSLVNGLFCASLIVFAASCGKENKSGSSANNQCALNPYIVGCANPYMNGTNSYTGNLGQVDQAAHQRVLNWMNGNTEGFPQQGSVSFVKKTSVRASQPTCTDKKFLGIPYSVCTFNGTPEVTTENLTANIIPDGRPIQQKAAQGNQELYQIYTGAAGQLIEARNIDNSRSQLSFLRGDGTVVIYGINTSRNSQLNPELKLEYGQTQQTQIEIQ